MSSHHGKDEFKRTPGSFTDELLKRHREQAIGKTNRLPGGKLSPSDEGELMFAVGTEQGRVVIHFKEPVAWLGMEPEDAVALAQMLVKKARSVSDRPLTMEL